MLLLLRVQQKPVGTSGDFLGCVPLSSDDLTEQAVVMVFAPLFPGPLLFAQSLSSALSRHNRVQVLNVSRHR
jgi:hypothetical protein